LEDRDKQDGGDIVGNSQDEVRFPDPKRRDDEPKDEIFSSCRWYEALFGKGKICPYDEKGCERRFDQEFSHAMV
jgi:hypothetical protein